MSAVLALPSTDYAEPHYTGTFGERLSAARQDAGLSKAAVGRAVGLSYQAVQQWERDTALPATAHIPVLEDALELQPGRIGSWVRYSPLVDGRLNPSIPGQLCHLRLVPGCGQDEGLAA